MRCVCVCMCVCVPPGHLCVVLWFACDCFLPFGQSHHPSTYAEQFLLNLHHASGNTFKPKCTHLCGVCVCVVCVYVCVCVCVLQVYHATNI